MANPITLAVATANYNAAAKAYQKALEGKSYSISAGGSTRSFGRQDIKELKAQMEYWAAEVERLSSSNTGIKIRYGFPIDAG